MCGRFEASFPEGKLSNPFEGMSFTSGVSDEKELKVYDIRPTNKIKCIYRDNNKNIVANVKWGIKFKTRKGSQINSRIETIKDSAYWYRMFDKNRAIIPMTSFYEWPEIDGVKQPQQRIYIEGMRVFYVPAIYQKLNDEINVSFITVPANKFMSKLPHHRMPVILTKEQATNYLTDEVDANLAKCIPLSDTIKMGNELYKK